MSIGSFAFTSPYGGFHLEKHVRAAGVKDLYGRKVRHANDAVKLFKAHGRPDLLMMGNFIVERDAVLSICREAEVNTIHGEDGFFPHYPTCHADPLGFCWESSLTRMTFRSMTRGQHAAATQAREQWTSEHPAAELPEAIRRPYVVFPLQLIGDRVNVRGANFRTWDDVVAKARAMLPPEVQMVVRGHPRGADGNKVAAMAGMKNTIECPAGVSLQALLSRAAGVIGCNSTVLLEARLMYRVPVWAFSQGWHTGHPDLVMPVRLDMKHLPRVDWLQDGVRDDRGDDYADWFLSQLLARQRPNADAAKDPDELRQWVYRRSYFAWRDHGEAIFDGTDTLASIVVPTVKHSLTAQPPEAPPEAKKESATPAEVGPAADEPGAGGSGGYDVTIITPTGDRPLPFTLCELYMSRQTFAGRVQWLVIDDGQTPTPIEFTRDGWTVQHVCRLRTPSDPPHTLTKNLQAAIPLVKADKVIIVEDDEWYSPEYIATTAGWLDEHDLVGQGRSIYCHIQTLRWVRNHNHRHASLCKTGFRAHLLERLHACCEEPDPRVDSRLWRWPGKKCVHVPGWDDQPLAIGFKGMPGRRGTMRDHIPDTRRYRSARAFDDTLSGWMGDEDASLYRTIHQDVTSPPHPEAESPPFATVIVSLPPASRADVIDVVAPHADDGDRLAAVYNVFDGEEWLEQSIRCLRETAHLVIAMVQSVSNVGHKYMGGVEEAERLKALGLIDHIEYFEPRLSIKAGINERAKRNVGLDVARRMGANWFISMDCDEMYRPDEFAEQWDHIREAGYDGTACRLYTYFGRTDLMLDPPEDYFVPFICRLDEATELRKYPCGFYVDPTRCPNMPCVEVPIWMHHYSWIRKDVRRKIRNSSAYVNLRRAEGQLIEAVSQPVEGMEVPFYRGRRLVKATVVMAGV
jgi:hypothetical protein